MRTPEEIRKEHVALPSMYGNPKIMMYNEKQVEEMIKTAQIEAIEECAGIAAKVLKHEHQEPLLDEINDEILQLKNQVR